ncbi:Serine/threonine protein phosphatase 7 long form isogeny [Arachis hypogaea]|nr:Serine/threonine protein phosphatase 7 long form isogeny [Arachis hypogaea]
MAGLYHLARLNESWFRLDEPLVSAFVERWRPETHTFHMPFGECTIILQDITYHLGLPINGQYVSRCLTDFPRYIAGGQPPWVWFEELLGVLPPANCIDKFTVKCTWFEETFSELPQGADEETVRRYARAYIMMLLSMQLFGDKSGTRLHIRWLPYVARLEDMGQYSSAALSWLYRWGGYQPSLSDKGPRVTNWRLRIDLLQPGDFLWMPYSLAEVVQVVHPEILEPRHMTLWRAATTLIYFAVIEWHPVDQVLPQFGGVQGRGTCYSLTSYLILDLLMSTLTGGISTAGGFYRLSSS